MKRVLVLTGACGSGKSTIAQALVDEHGWIRVSEDDVWRRQFHKNRGRIGSDEHREKRSAVRREVVAAVRRGLEEADVVVDATVHEADPSSVGEYEDLFGTSGVSWQVRVLHPRLEVVVRRDETREGWRAGAAGVTALWRKFSGHLFDSRVFIDTSEDEPSDTARKVLESLAVELPTRSGGTRVRSADGV